MSSFPQYLNTLLFMGFTFGFGCVEKASEDLICSGNGELHGDHCDCDAGFVLSEDGYSCDPDPDYENSQYDGDFIFAPSNVQASTGTENNARVWFLEAIDSDVQLNIAIYESYGGLSSPGSIIIDSTEMDYATCGNCLILQTGCSAHGDHSHCERSFMPIAGGEIRIDKIGTNSGDEFAGELIGITFQEVTIGQNYQTEPVVDGEEIALVPWQFDTLLESF